MSSAKAVEDGGIFVAHSASYGNGTGNLRQAVENRDISFYAAIFDGFVKILSDFPTSGDVGYKFAAVFDG